MNRFIKMTACLAKACVKLRRFVAPVIAGLLASLILVSPVVYAEDLGSWEAHQSDNAEVLGHASSPEAACAIVGAFFTANGGVCGYDGNRNTYSSPVYADNGSKVGGTCYFTLVGSACGPGMMVRQGGSYRRCAPGTRWDPTYSACLRYVDKYYDKPCDECSAGGNPGVGNPIYPLTGVKTQEVDLGIRIGDMKLSMIYDTRPQLPEANGLRPWIVPAPPSFGPLWQSNLHKSAVLQSNGGAGSAYSNVAVQLGGGKWITASVQGFESCSAGGGGTTDVISVYVPEVDRNVKLNYTDGKAMMLHAKRLTEERFDVAGAVTQVASARGPSLTYSYSDAGTPTSIAPGPGLLILITDTLGRTVQFTYEQPPGVVLKPRIVSVAANGEPAVEVSYDAVGNLNKITWRDGTVRRFVYERTDLPWALTGIVDENNSRHSTYGYDWQGRAISTELTEGVNKYTVSPPTFQLSGWTVTETITGSLICREHRWTAPGDTLVSDPAGASRQMGATVKEGMVALSSLRQTAGSGSPQATSGMDYDDRGNLIAFTALNGGRSCYAYDTSRGLRTKVLEGLFGTTACPASLSNYTPTGSDASQPQRITSLLWHPDWALETARAEPGRRITSVYNGQPDPFQGNTLASCAPAAPLLPDGKPLALLCRQVEQATTDASGAMGFDAPLQVGVPSRETRWTYNQFGRVLTEDGPRSDVNDMTLYEYHLDTTADHTLGDLKRVTNAAGKASLFNKYNKHGQVLESTDGNGVLTVNTYDLRQRLKSSTVGGQTTSYTYDAVGQLKRITQPDASYVGFDYDAAHRQVGVYDHKGNRIEYTLDNAGNKTAQKVKDPAGVLKRQMTQSIDALGRVQQTTGRE